MASLIALMLLTLSAHASTFHCTPAGSVSPVTVLVENKPEAGSAQVITGSNTTHTQWSETNSIERVSCYEVETLTKTFFHPYFTYIITAETRERVPHTQCGETTPVTKYSGTFSGEMQRTQHLDCSLIN